MKWIHDFELFLFDFDGLLVNTEEIHYLAYKKMCAARGIDFTWDFDSYCRVAHYSSDGLREQIYAQYPFLMQQEPSWDVLYAEKKQAVLNLLNDDAVHLMPGVENLLKALQDANIPCCVVTHSPQELIEIVKSKHTILSSIPEWITRQDYSRPKPDPECYLKAIKMYAKPQDRIIGFEDSPRGLTALMGTPAKPVLVTPIHYPEIPSFKAKGALYFSSFEEIPHEKLSG